MIGQTQKQKKITIGFLLFGVLLLIIYLGLNLRPVQFESSTVDRETPSLFGFINEPIQPLVRLKIPDSKKVSLGKLIFNESRLSLSGRKACSSCHDVSNAGINTASLDPVIQTKRNIPTVFNSLLNDRFYWDGRELNVDDLIRRNISGESELNSDWSHVIKVLREDSRYREKFRAIYKAEATAQHVTEVLVAYLQTLVTENSRFDQFLLGDKSAISEDELKGYELFKSYGCSVCHQGMNVGGNMFIYDDVHNKRSVGSLADTGKQKKRVPSLRNVSRTAPYLHDGRINNLSETISEMAENHLGKSIPENNRLFIVKFLTTLSDQGDDLVL